MNQRSFLIQWNNKRPLDYLYRKKHSIGFNSPEHRKVSQVDVYLDWLEEQLYKEFEDKAKDEIQREKEYEKGVWLRESQIDIPDDFFDKIDVEDLGSQIQIDD